VINAVWISVSEPVEFFRNPVRSGSGLEFQNPVGSRSGNWIMFNAGTNVTTPYAKVEILQVRQCKNLFSTKACA